MKTTSIIYYYVVLFSKIVAKIRIYLFSTKIV